MFFTQKLISSLFTLILITMPVLLSGCSNDESPATAAEPANKLSFQRISNFPVYLNSQFDHKTSAQNLAVSEDGNTLVYTNRSLDGIGFVDIETAATPVNDGVLAVGGNPTSVVVRGQQLLVTVDTSSSFVNVSGKLLVIDMSTRSELASYDLAGQPDVLSISPDGRYVAIVIENKRDLDLNNGVSAQAPEGLLEIYDVTADVANWTSSLVNLTGLAGLLADDPEPVSVDINTENIAVISLQKNNHFVMVDFVNGSVQQHFSAGSVDLNQIDASVDSRIALTDNRTSVLREPDGVHWLGTEMFASVDEKGGSGGVTIYNNTGNVLYDSADKFEHTLVQYGHFPDRLAGQKSNRALNLDYARFGTEDYLFVASERASSILVYRLSANEQLEFVQLLPGGVRTEGLLVIPGRNLLVAAGSEDERNQNIRSTLTLYQLESGDAKYPTLLSGNDDTGLPIGFGAISGLTVDAQSSNIAWAVSDAFYNSSRIFKLDISTSPARINSSIIIKDSQGILAAANVDLVNGDSENSVNIDAEGISMATAGGFWIASEGKGESAGNNPSFDYENYLLRVSVAGVIEQLVKLPAHVLERQVDDGFEGVASVMEGNVEMLYVAFQEGWNGDRDNFVRIGQYNTLTEDWKFLSYPLDLVDPDIGGKVGLSDITYAGNDELIVVERDNRSGLQARIKRLYKFSITSLVAEEDDATNNVHFPEINKILVDDLLDDLKSTGGQVLEKIEGVAVTSDNTILVINDNDGVDGSNGETQLLRLKGLL